MNAAPRSTRREFLQGKAATALLDVGSPDEGALPAPTPEGHLLCLSRRAMACTFQVFINADRHKHGTEAALAALDLVDRLEDQLSVYRDNSEISRLNRDAAQRAVEVESDLFALLVRAAEIHRATGGAFDVTAGRLSDVWGFKRRQGKIPTADELAAARASIGSEHLELDQTARRVRFLRAGLEINLGSIGKGYALDRAARWLEAEGIGDFLLQGGRSSVLARGTCGASSGERGWLVGVRNPLDPARRIGQVRLTDRALATSGSGTQFFVHDNRRYGHILDPRSGWPAEGVLSTTVLAPSAADADALATALYVMGAEAARDYCRARPEVAALMMCPGPGEGSVETHRFGLDPNDWTALDEP